MNEKEKLVELILECDKSNEVLSCFNERPRKRQAAEILADHLLANGVVVVDMNVVSPKNRPLISQCLGRPIDEIIELVHARDEGRIIVPPCKVGDDLYYPWVYGGTSGIAILEADAIKSYVQGRSLVFFKSPESDMPMPSYFREEDFGETVFRSRKLAEEALNEQKKL